MVKPELDSTTSDKLAAAARGIAAACPVIGGLVAEAVNSIIPNQKLDRVIGFLRYLDERVSILDRDLSGAASRLQDERGLDLLEDGIVQAARAVTEERRTRIGNLLARSLTQEELKYAESKKLLNLLRELTDAELLFLVYYSEPPYLGFQYHRDLTEKHPDVLRPASRILSIPQDEIDRGALRDSYLSTLVRLGLLQQKENQYSLASLGRLLLRYIQQEETEAENSA